MPALVCGVPAARQHHAASRSRQSRLGGGGSARAAVAAAAPLLLQLRGGLRRLQARPARLARAQAGAGGAGGNSSSGSGSDHSSRSGSEDSTQAEDTSLAANSQLPELGDAEQLLQSLGLSGAASPPKLLGNMSKLHRLRQREVLQHAAAVVQHLCGPSVGLTQQQAAQLLEGCPELFSREPEQRAAPLFGELMAAGLTAAEAARCFLVYPTTAERRSLAAGLSELAAILAHSRDKQGGSGRRPKVPAAERTVAALLRRIPSAVRLVGNTPGWLQQRSEQLQQTGFSAAHVAALAWQRPEFIVRDSPAQLQRATAVLEEQLGLSPAEVVGLAASRKPTWLSSSANTLQARGAALAQGFSKVQAAAIVKTNHSALECPPEVWQRNLRCMAACGVADPKAALTSSPALLHLNHAAPGFVQRRLLLQRCFGLTAAQLYEGPAWCLHLSTPAELAQRLQFIEQCGQQHRLAAKAAKRGAAARLPPHERPLTLKLVCIEKQPAFLAAVGASEAEWAAFERQLPPARCALYSWAQQAAEQEVARLRAALPPELRLVEKKQPRFGGRQRTEASIA